MTGTLISVSSLLLSIGILLTGNALQGTLLVIRGHAEGFSTSIIGLVMAMYFAGFIIGTFLCPLIIRRVGHIRAFSTTAALCAGTIVIMGLWVNPWVWGVTRLLLGICIVGIFMVTESWLNTQAVNENRGRMFSVYIMVNLVSMAGGQFLLTAGDMRTMELFAIAAALYSLGIVPVAMTRLPQPAAVTGFSIRLRELYRTSALGFTGALVAGLLNSLFWSLAPLYARLSNLNDMGVALFMSSAILGGLVFLWPIGRWSDRHDRRAVFIYISTFSAMAALLALLAPPGSRYWLSLCMFFYGGMMFSIYPLSVAHTNDHPDATDRVSVTSNLLFVYSLGAVMGPLLGGILMQTLGHYLLFGLFIFGGAVLGVCAAYWRKHGMAISTADKGTFTPYVRTSPVAVRLESAS